MFKINQLIRVIPNTFENLIKSDFHLIEHLKESLDNNHNDQFIMLGGRYSILDIRKKDNEEWLKLIYNESMSYISSDFVIEDEKVKTCPYKIGDKVIIDLDSPNRENEYLLYFLSNSIIHDKVEHIVDKIFTIGDIINLYYVVLEYDRFNNGLPIKWTKFKKI